jgi:hypothetical protein
MKVGSLVIYRNLDILTRQLENPQDAKYLRSFERMRTEAEIEQFKQWCSVHPVKGVRGIVLLCIF